MLAGQRFDVRQADRHRGLVIMAMMPLVMMPLASVFILGFSKGPLHFWEALMAPAALFSLKLSLITSSVATLCNVIFGLLAAYVMSKYEFAGDSSLNDYHQSADGDPDGSGGFRFAFVVGAVWVAWSIAGAYRPASHVHDSGDHSGQYFCDVPRWRSE